MKSRKVERQFRITCSIRNIMTTEHFTRVTAGPFQWFGKVAGSWQIRAGAHPSAPHNGDTPISFQKEPTQVKGLLPILLVNSTYCC